MVKKKLLVVTSEYFHPLTTRLHHMLPLLSEYFEIGVVAITSSSYDPSRKGKRGVIAIMKLVVSTILLSLKREKPRKGGVIVLHYLFPENRFMSPFGHLIESLIIAWIMKIRKIGKGYDVCLATPVLAGFPTLLAKIPVPIVYEDWDRFEFFMTNRLSRRIVRFMENYCLRNSSEVISAGYRLAESAQHIRGKRARCIPNGVNLKLFRESLGTHDVKDKFGIVYVGYISEWSGLEKAIEALPLITFKFPSASLHIIGTGVPDSIKRLSNLAARLKVSANVAFMGPKKHEELPRLMRGFAIGIATFPNTKLMQYAFPLKIMEYLAAGLPVVATDVGDTGEILRKTTCGVLVNNTPASIAEGIIQILGDEDYAESLAANGREWVEMFDLNRLALEEVDVLLKISRTIRS